MRTARRERGNHGGLVWNKKMWGGWLGRVGGVPLITFDNEAQLDRTGSSDTLHWVHVDSDLLMSLTLIYRH